MSGDDFNYDLYELEYGIKLDGEQVEAGAPPNQPFKEKATENNRQAVPGLYDFLQCIVTAVVCAILIFIFVGRITGIDGTSMLDTLHDEDIVITANLFFTPRYGDIVIIESDALGEPIVKRVIATAGQTIDIDFVTGEVMIDGKLIVEDYILEPTTTQFQFEGPVTVPEGCVFVMGDNRNGSKDSRSEKIGMVDIRTILGKALLLIIPGESEASPRDWSRFGSVYA